MTIPQTPNPQKPFIVANVREVYQEYELENISFSRMVEVLNEMVTQWVVQKEDGLDMLVKIKQQNIMGMLRPGMPEKDIVTAIDQWMVWANINFSKSTAQSSLVHLRREIKEVLNELDSDDPHPRQDGATMTLMEYADSMICLITAAGKSGLTADQLFSAIKNKMYINMHKRKWQDNGDGTYSHIKEDNQAG